MWSWGPPPGEAQPFKGMVYGMNTRMPSGPGPAVTSGLWSVWDTFGIAAARMVGYWSPRPAVSVHATATATATAPEQQQHRRRWRPGAADTRGGGQPGSLGVLATAYVLRGANNDSDDTNNTTNRTLIAAASWNSTTTVASRRVVDEQ